MEEKPVQSSQVETGEVRSIEDDEGQRVGRKLFLDEVNQEALVVKDDIEVKVVPVSGSQPLIIRYLGKF